VKREEIVYEYLKGRDWTSPTQIGRELFNSHSQVGSPICKRLVAKGLVERSKNGWYRIIGIGDSLEEQPQERG